MSTAGHKMTMDESWKIEVVGIAVNSYTATYSVRKKGTGFRLERKQYYQGQGTPIPIPDERAAHDTQLQLLQGRAAMKSREDQESCCEARPHRKGGGLSEKLYWGQDPYLE